MGIFEDRVDKRDWKSSMHSHLVKWWDVNYVPQPADNDASNDTDNVSKSEPSVDVELNAEEALLLDSVLGQHDNTKAFENAMATVDEQERLEKKKLEDEANEIFNRLMREAKEDEDKKQQLINEAYAAQDEI